MRIRAGFEIGFEYPEPTAVVLTLFLHPSRMMDIRNRESFSVLPVTPITEYVDLYGNRCARVFVPQGRTAFRNDFTVEDDGLPDKLAWNARQHEVQELPDETLVYLLPSRYCDTDSELREVAKPLFYGTPLGWARVQAICDFVNRHIRFDYMLARANRSATEAYREAVGVCRDYTHLAIAFCRIMNIPARYCTGYLGDIGVPVVLPMDFSAWFEVYLGGRWHTFDARNNTPRIGRVLIARGRDAADVPLTMSFGLNRLSGFDVWTYEEAG
ncbi:MAG: transglutaminase family protein [Fibrobacteres bacterium]|jgi:transglutaminase-like putative cysteine protease|nr:transglutaminase family protein [Fibrobacterota bacterium]